MKIVVCIKQVPDTETKIRLNANRDGIDESGIKWVVNPYDEFAIEEALRIKEAKGNAQVVVLGVGPKARVTEALRTGLAMGADEAVVVDTNEALDPRVAALALARAIAKQGQVDLVLTGKLAIDDNASSVPQMLAEHLKLPHATVVSKLSEENGNWVAEREVEGGAREIVQLNGPAVIAANKGLNTPRYASLPGIMKARKKPVNELTFTDLDMGGDSAAQAIKLVDFQLPPEKPPVKMLSGNSQAQAAELVNLLLNEAKVL